MRSLSLVYLIAGVFGSADVLGFLFHHSQVTLFHQDGVRNFKSSHLLNSIVEVDADSILDPDLAKELTDLIDKRSKARWSGDYFLADKIRNDIKQFEQNLLPEQLRLVITDIARGKGGGSSWSIIYNINERDDAAKTPSVLQLAHKALGIAVFHSERELINFSDKLKQIESAAKAQLVGWRIWCDRRDAKFHVSNAGIVAPCDDSIHWISVEQGLSGRKAADAAFCFAMAGSVDQDLFALLTQVCVKELRRFGARSSCRAKDIMSIVERLAAAGVTESDNDDLLDAIKSALRAKGDESQFEPKYLNMHRKNTGLVIWKQSFLRRAAIRLKNAAVPFDDRNDERTQTQSHLSSPNELCWESLFVDPKRPLVVDVGCGMGISLLGLASTTSNESEVAFSVDWTRCNYVGVDQSSLTINYAKGIAHRWKIDGHTAFFVDTAECFLKKLESYPGLVQLILIQFPTPYHLSNSTDSALIHDSYPLKQRGNSRLPKSATDGFMVTSELLVLASELLQEGRGELLLQSNCEDVAVWMRRVACDQADFTFRQSDFILSPVEAVNKRTSSWIKLGGKRAIGEGWCPHPILPENGRSETEIACIVNETPIHRCVLTPKTR